MATAATAAPARVASWNIGEKGLAALAAATPGGLGALFEGQLSRPDIVCLQETKLSGPDKLTSELANVPGYTSYFAFCRAATGGSLVRASYAGTATYVRHGVPTLGACGALGEPLRSAAAQHCEPESERLDTELLTLAEAGDVDSEGRALLTDHGAFVLLNLYCPASGREVERKGYKRRFHEAVSVRCANLRQRGRQVLVVGDLNVAPLALDVHRGMHEGGGPPRRRPEPQAAEAEEEEDPWDKKHWFREQLGAGFVDCFRLHHPTRTNAFTFWPVVSRARETNTGARLDHILASEEAGGGGLAKAATRCDISPEVMGSDHCPIWVELSLPLLRSEQQGKRAPPPLATLPPLCTSHLKRLRSSQQGLGSYLTAAAPATEAAAPAESGARKREATAAPQGGRRKQARQQGPQTIDAFFSKRSSGNDPAAAAVSMGGSAQGNGAFGSEAAALREAIARS